jgi:hypothetical protein
MIELAVKVLLTSVLVVAVTEAAKRNVLLGAVIASLPLTSILAMIWLYADTGDTEKVASLATGILWLVVPSLVLFIALPLLLRGGVSFWVGLPVAALLTIASYFAMVRIMKMFGVEI